MGNDLHRDALRRAARCRAVRTATASSRSAERDREGLSLLLLLTILIFLLFLLRPASAQAETLRCGEGIRLEFDVRTAPRGALDRPSASSPKLGNTDIVLYPGAGLSSRPQALAAWNAAVAIWEAVLDDPITVEISGNIAALGPGVLGSTQPVAYTSAYNSVRNALVNDADSDEPSAQALPTLAQKQLSLPPGFSDSGSALGTKANLKALGFDMSFDPDPDATMVFSSSFESQFDYDPSDGISPGKYDFVAIVVHELGHALGFASDVDRVDYYRSQGQTAAVYPNTLDLFRLLPGASANFSTAARCLRSGDLAPNQVCYIGTSELAMSTGVQLGDGRQASHWKADELSGSYIGIMDPTLATGQHVEMTQNDIVAMGLIGWDIVESAPVAAPPRRSAQIQLTAVPNPFNPKTSVQLHLASSGRVRIELFNAAGRLLHVVHDGELPAGEHGFSWDGRDASGARLASGMYFVRAQTRTDQAVLKVVMLE